MHVCLLLLVASNAQDCLKCSGLSPVLPYLLMLRHLLWFLLRAQVVVLAESLLHHLPGQPALAARLLQHLLHGAGNSTYSSSSIQQQHQQDHGTSSNGPEHEASAAAAAAECAVLGPGSRLPVACLTLQERAALLRWVAACAPHDQANKLQRELSRTSSRQQHARPGQDGESGLVQSQDWPPFGRGSSRSSSRQDTTSSPAPTGSHLQGLTSPRGDWPTGRYSVEPQQQAPEQLADISVHHLQELRRLQESLGQPAQREWVTTCAPLPHTTSGGPSSSSSIVYSTQQQTQGAGRRLKPAVAAAVAAMSGGPAVAAAPQPGVVLPGGSSAPPVPPSRLFVQEADAEMRLATVLVSQQGL